MPAETAEGKAAREDRSRIFGPAIAANKAGDAVQAAKLAREAVFQLGPGGFDREPQAVQTRVLDNARTIPLLFAAPASPPITCDMLKNFTQPTLVMRGEKTQVSFALISEAISKCIPGALKMSTIMGRVVIRQRSPVQSLSSCQGVEQSTPPHLDVRTSSCDGR